MNGISFCVRGQFACTHTRNERPLWASKMQIELNDLNDIEYSVCSCLSRAQACSLAILNEWWVFAHATIGIGASLPSDRFKKFTINPHHANERSEKQFVYPRSDLFEKRWATSAFGATSPHPIGQLVCLFLEKPFLKGIGFLGDHQMEDRVVSLCKYYFVTSDRGQATMWDCFGNTNGNKYDAQVGNEANYSVL